MVDDNSYSMKEMIDLVRGDIKNLDDKLEKYIEKHGGEHKKLEEEILTCRRVKSSITITIISAITTVGAIVFMVIKAIK